MEDKIVEIARFYEPEAAQMIESLLKSEGVNCYPVSYTHLTLPTSDLV